MKKELHESLTVKSAVAICALVLAKVLLPVLTNYEVPDSIFESICAVLGVSVTVGLRRALPVLIVGFLSFSTIQCGPSVCQKATIEITKHPELPSPAGTVTVKCDGKEKAVLLGKEVKK
jgi:hypothetical protein